MFSLTTFLKLRIPADFSELCIVLALTSFDSMKFLPVSVSLFEFGSSPSSFIAPKFSPYLSPVPNSFSTSNSMIFGATIVLTSLFTVKVGIYSLFTVKVMVIEHSRNVKCHDCDDKHDNERYF